MEFTVGTNGDAEGNHVEPDQTTTLKFKFSGNAKEYFGIWIVNTLLRIITFGIYSPWAKVRKRRYFYNNTLLDNKSFDYLANPLAILKGWLIALLLVALYSLANRLNPLFAMPLSLIFMALFPWVIVRSRAFTLHNTSHRNIRFVFKKNYKEAYKAFLWMMLLSTITFGIMTPYAIWRQRRFLVENSQFGNSSFNFDATPKQYVRIIMFPLLISMLIMVVAVFVLVFMLQGARLDLEKPVTEAIGAVVFLGIAIFYIGYMFMALYIHTAITNLTWNSTSINNFRFSSKLKVLDLAWLYLSSGVAIICSLGLLTPWATVRILHYRLEKLTMVGTGSLDTITASAQKNIGATSEELGEIFGFDLGL